MSFWILSFIHSFSQSFIPLFIYFLIDSFRHSPYPRVNCLKTIPFTAAHTYIAHIWQYPPPPPPPDHAIQYRSIKDRNCGQGKKRKTTTTSNCLRRAKIYYQRKKTRQTEINPACWCQTKKEVCARHWEKDTIFSVLAIFLRICSFTLPILCY